MKLSQLNIEELVELRTKMILERQDTKEINEIIDDKEREYSAYLVEDGEVGSSGVAFANAGIAGMGGVVASQPSALAGATIGNDWSDHGGSVGSGDVSFPFPVGGKNMQQKTSIKGFGKNHGARTGKKSRVKPLDLKALKNAFAKRQDYTQNAAPSTKRVMDFDAFQKSDLMKVTRVKQ